MLNTGNRVKRGQTCTTYTVNTGIGSNGDRRVRTAYTVNTEIGSNRHACKRIHTYSRRSTQARQVIEQQCKF